MHCKAVFVRKYSTSLNDVGAVIPDLINHQRVSQTDADIAFLEIYGPSSLRGDVSVKPSSIFHPCLVAVPCRPSPTLTLDLEPPLQLFFSISPTFLLIQPFAAVPPSVNAVIFPRVKTLPPASNTAVGHQPNRECLL